MDENNLAKEIIVAVAKENSKEVYCDLAKPALKNIGEIFGTITGWFNNVAFYPVKRANIEYCYKLEDFARQLAEKAIDIPPDKLVEPPLRIAGPVLEGMKYSYDEDEIRDMFLNLLASAMNSDIQSKTHPSYVQSIQRMSAFDAIVFKSIYDMHDSIPCAKVTICFDRKYLTKMTPRYFCPDLYGQGDPFAVSKSIELLHSLSLFDLFEGKVKSFDYSEIEQHTYIQGRLELARKYHPDKELVIKQNTCVIQSNNYGSDFGEICFSKNVG